MIENLINSASQWVREVDVRCCQLNTADKIINVVKQIAVTCINSHMAMFCLRFQAALMDVLRQISAHSESSIIKTCKITRYICDQKNRGHFNPLEFNKIATELKQQREWKKNLQADMEEFSYSCTDALVAIHPLSFRGCDQEVLLEFYNHLRNKVFLCQKGGVDFRRITSALNALIDVFKVDVIDVDKNDETQLKPLNKGAVNAVYKVSFQPGKWSRMVERVFKPASIDLPSWTQWKERFCGTAVASGIAPGAGAHLSSRAVASSILDQELYGKRGGASRRISVETKFAQVNGQRGIIMEMAKGGSPEFAREVQEPVVIPHLTPEMWLKIKDPSDLAHLLNYRRIEEKNGQFIGTRAEITNFDPHNPITIENLIRLQIKDIIAGECDRHPGNYHIDEKGCVKGIDEDCCFGVNAMPDAWDVRKQSSLLGLIPNRGSLMLRVPPVITQEMYRDIMQLKTNLPALVQNLSPHISNDEIQAMIRRLNALVLHIQDSNKCRIVSTQEALLLPEQQILMDTNNSYYKRELLLLLPKKNNWNYLRAHRDF